MKKIAILGGSFNPPAIHHRNIVEKLVDYFDEIIIMPCGPRPDKPSTNIINPIHKIKMINMTFLGIPKVSIEYYDLKNNIFTRTHEIDAMFKDKGELWHIVGSDIVEHGGTKNSLIHKVWQKPDYVWKNLKFCVIEREGYKLLKQDLPPNVKIFNIGNSGASSTIRNNILKNKSITDLVIKDVKDYIIKNKIYKK